MRSSLIWVCTVCSDLSVPIFKIITVILHVYYSHTILWHDVIHQKTATSYDKTSRWTLAKFHAGLKRMGTLSEETTLAFHFFVPL